MAQGEHAATVSEYETAYQAFEAAETRHEEIRVPVTVFANARGVAHKGSGGMSTVFPDVCKTPTPGGPVPIPYPNMGKSADTTAGPTTVKNDGQMPMTKDA